MLRRTLRAGCMASAQRAVVPVNAARAAFRALSTPERWQGAVARAQAGISGCGLRAMLGPGLPRCRGRWGVWWLEWSGAGARWSGRGASTGARQAAWGRRGCRRAGLVEAAGRAGGASERRRVGLLRARRGAVIGSRAGGGVRREAVAVRGAALLRAGSGLSRRARKRARGARPRGGRRSRWAAGVAWSVSTCGAEAARRWVMGAPRACPPSRPTQ